MKPPSHRPLAIRVGLLAGLLFVLQLACSLPSLTSATAVPTSTSAARPGEIQPPPSYTSQPPTVAPTLTPAPAAATPGKSISPTLSPTATSKPATPSGAGSPSPSPTPTLTPTVQVLYKGFLAYDQKQETVSGYDFNGAPLNIKIKISGAEYLGFNEAQWANNSIYYVHKKNKTVNQIAQNGAAQKLNFIPSKNNLHFLISPDGKKIAWSFDVFTNNSPSSELWLANIDGSGAKKIATTDAANNPKWLVVQPYRWLADGRLLYIDAPTGIGGYILFYGFAGLHAYDPANGKIAALTPTSGAGGLCLREISPDLKTILSTCTGSSQNILSYITLADNKSLSIARQADQNQVGSPAYSPSGAWLAYAYARAEPASETGRIALVASGATNPKIVDTVPGGYYTVAGWTGENHFLVQRYEGDLASASIWLYPREAGTGKKLATGTFVSFIK